mmetsp:Transcript_35849/g.78525  ORF Transcript_35849/g.78525 Transcript_35849/m.78525 type:complete len:83 (-) Transcript_35849:58-306(-)
MRMVELRGMVLAVLSFSSGPESQQETRRRYRCRQHGCRKKATVLLSEEQGSLPATTAEDDAKLCGVNFLLEQSLDIVTCASR